MTQTFLFILGMVFGFFLGCAAIIVVFFRKKRELEEYEKNVRGELDKLVNSRYKVFVEICKEIVKGKHG